MRIVLAILGFGASRLGIFSRAAAAARVLRRGVQKRRKKKEEKENDVKRRQARQKTTDRLSMAFSFSSASHQAPRGARK
jgi:Sec-independent protein translocase protein TatA